MEFVQDLHTGDGMLVIRGIRGSERQDQHGWLVSRSPLLLKVRVLITFLRPIFEFVRRKS